MCVALLKKSRSSKSPAESIRDECARLASLKALSCFLTLACHWRFDRVANFKLSLTCLVYGELAASCLAFAWFFNRSQVYCNLLGIFEQ